VFYLAVLPQFLTPSAGLGWLLVLAWSHAVLGLSYQLALVTGLHGARRLLMRRKVRRGPRRHHRRRAPRLQRQARHRTRLDGEAATRPVRPKWF
jgi:hypothetical protein